MNEKKIAEIRELYYSHMPIGYLEHKTCAYCGTPLDPHDGAITCPIHHLAPEPDITFEDYRGTR